MAENVYRELIEDPSDRVIVALDDMTWDRAVSVMRETHLLVGMGKINSLAQNDGWQHATNLLADLGSLTMADEKFHDTPKTVELEVVEVAKSGPAFITVHASGGLKMMEAAVQGSETGEDIFLETHDYQDYDPRFQVPPGILAITILTSLDEQECLSIYGATPEKKVLQLARLAAEAQVDGIVCSGQELRAIRAIPDLDHLVTVVPGITPSWAKKAHDQSRIVTPAEAVESGADFIVVGRAITQPPDGMAVGEAAARIAEEIREAS